MMCYSCLHGQYCEYIPSPGQPFDVVLRRCDIDGKHIPADGETECNNYRSSLEYLRSQIDELRSELERIGAERDV